MSLTSCTRALSLRWPVLALMPIWLWLALAGSVHAQTSKVVVWLDGGEGGRSQARERALRLELEARGMVLLRADGAPSGTPGPAAPSNREALARQTLVRTGAEAVLWLEGDASRPVSWLRIARPDSDAIEQAPLPHPPDAIEPELFAVAAASLLQQVLREPTAGAGPGVEPPAQPSLEPAKVAEAASAAAPARSPPPSRTQPAPAARPAAVRPPEPPPLWFVQAGVVLSLGHLTSGMEASSEPTRDEIYSNGPGWFDAPSYFDDRSAWVPDADSFDDFEDPTMDIPRGVTPAPGHCEADGIVTGPGEWPSRFCVRIEQPGFAIMPALHLLLGGWVAPRLALGFLYQGYFGVDPDTIFGNTLFGLHAEYVALGARGRGVTLSLLAQLTVGRTETPVPPPDPERPTPNAWSGPFGGLGGALVRFWPVSDFALFVAPAGGFRFPAGQLVIDLTAGAELAY